MKTSLLGYRRAVDLTGIINLIYRAPIVCSGGALRSHLASTELDFDQPDCVPSRRWRRMLLCWVSLQPSCSKLLVDSPDSVLYAVFSADVYGKHSELMTVPFQFKNSPKHLKLACRAVQCASSNPLASTENLKNHYRTFCLHGKPKENRRH